MIKSVILLLNLLGFLICRFFFLPSVDVSQSLPFSAVVNTSFIVQVAINKSDVKGFGKFTEQLPAGLTAVPLELQGANATFENNTIQFSWDSLPSDGIINISFRVDVGSASISQKDTLSAKFLYTSDNQKLEADAMPSYINITGSSNTAAPTARVIDSVQTGAGSVFVKRKFPSSSVPPNSDAVIALTIHKQNISGFGKVEETLPEGFTAAGMDLQGASFTYVDNIAKFVWQNLPSDSVITISYRLIAGSNVNGTVTLSGSFSYLYNNMPSICPIGTTIFNTTVIASNSGSVTPVSPSINTNNTNSPVIVANTNTVQPVSMNSNNGTSNPTNSNADITPSIPSPQTGVNYRVQIMALLKPVGVSYFQKFGLKAAVNTEMTGGFTKYTTGSYTDYKAVHEGRESIKNTGIKGPFVVAYNSGTRITVQEALMISHQQWLK